MSVITYNSMLFILNRNRETVGLLNNLLPKACPYFNDVYTENIENNLNTFVFEIPSDHSSAELIEVEGYILYTDLDYKHNLFTIKEIIDIRNQTNTKRIYCEHSSVDDLIGNIVRPIQMNSYNLQQAADIALQNTGWEIGNIAYKGVADVHINDYATSLAVLNQIASAFDVEIEYEVVFDGTKVTKKIVNMIERRGNVTNKIFEYTKDLTSVERVEDSKNLVTALIGIGKNDANGNPLTFMDYPAPVDSRYKKINDYIADIEAFQLFNHDGKHIFGVYKDDSATNYVELYNNTLNKLKELSKPMLTFTCNIITLERLTGYEHEKVRIGDTVLVKDWSFNPALIIEARIIEIKRSKTDSTLDSVIIGDYVPIQIGSNEQVEKLQQIIFQKEQQWTLSGENSNKALEEVQNLDEKVSEIDNRTSETAIIGTVVYSEDFTSILSDKANLQDISDMATSEQISKAKGEAIDYVDGRLDDNGGINDKINAVTSELTSTENRINAKFTSSGGVNLVRNSLGYADFDFWNVTGTVHTIQNIELEQLGFGSAFVSYQGEEGYIEQVINTSKATDHAISFWIKKPTDKDTGIDSNIGVELYANGELKAFIGKLTNETNDLYELALYPFTTEYSEVTVRITFGAGAEGYITGLMVNVGLTALQWQHHPQEIYNTNIQMNLNGIKVINQQTKGYTVMSPIEFSGYAEVLDEQNKPTMERIFTLNGDTTEVTKLNTDKEINMSPIKIVPITSTDYNGWAFIGE